MTATSQVIQKLYVSCWRYLLFPLPILRRTVNLPGLSKTDLLKALLEKYPSVFRANFDANGTLLEVILPGFRSFRRPMPKDGAKRKGARAAIAGNLGNYLQTLVNLGKQHEESSLATDQIAKNSEHQNCAHQEFVECVSEESAPALSTY